MKSIFTSLALLAAVPFSFVFLPTPTKVQPDTQAAPGMRVNRVLLFSPYPYEVKPGDALTLQGSGFSKSLNKVYFNGSNPVTATSSNGTILKISVPTSLSEGQYKLTVSNILGSSENPKISIYIKVTNNPQPPPTITTATSTGNIVNIIGTGFTSSNIVISTFGNSPSLISANGTNLSFNIKDLSQYEKVKQSTKGKKYKIPVWIYVQNENGTSKDPYKLYITI